MSEMLFYCVSISDNLPLVGNLGAPVSQANRQEIEDGLSSDDDELESVCRKRPLLDGLYFKPCKEGSDVNGTILAACQNCNPATVIRVSLRATSNCTSHLKVRTF